MARLVRFRVLDGIAVVTLDSPPVNALSLNLRGGLWQAFSRIEDNPDIKGAVLMAAGPMFSAGVDVRELGRDMARPTLAELCDKIENCPKPVVGAVSGQALGGGSELLLACHYRLAGPQARLGLPDVALGLVPSAGGTQRLPRLIGAERALQLMVSAQSVDAGSAKRTGLFDGIVQGDLGSGAIAFTQDLLKADKRPRRTRDARKHLADGPGYAAAITKAKTALADNPLHAPHRVIDCVEAAWLLPFEAGMAFEEDAVARCWDHPQSTALRHVFVAERRIDEALIQRNGASFDPVEPMGKSVVQRLRTALRDAAGFLVTNGAKQHDIDGAMVSYGFRKGPFGGKDKGDDTKGLARRLVAAMMVEGAACVEQEAVQRPSDIDALAVHGLGFPRRMGGPMRAAQTEGLIALRNDMRKWAEESAIWAVPDLMDQAIKDAAGFDAWT